MPSGVCEPQYQKVNQMCNETRKNLKKIIKNCKQKKNRIKKKFKQCEKDLALAFEDRFTEKIPEEFFAFKTKLKEQRLTKKHKFL